MSKLIRSKIPAIAEQNNDTRWTFEFYNAQENPSVHQTLLEDKLKEESIEFIESIHDTDNVYLHQVEEAADVLEVLISMIANKHVSDRAEIQSDILTKLQDKFTQRGGFTEGVILTN